MNNAVNNQAIYTTLLQQQFQLYKGDDKPDGIIGVIMSERREKYMIPKLNLPSLVTVLYVK